MGGCICPRVYFPWCRSDCHNQFCVLSQRGAQRMAHHLHMPLRAQSFREGTQATEAHMEGGGGCPLAGGGMYSRASGQQGLPGREHLGSRSPCGHRRQLMRCTPRGGWRRTAVSEMTPGLGKGHLWTPWLPCQRKHRWHAHLLMHGAGAWACSLWRCAARRGAAGGEAGGCLVRCGQFPIISHKKLWLRYG